MIADALILPVGRNAPMAANDSFSRRSALVGARVGEGDDAGSCARVVLAVSHDFMRFAVGALLVGSGVVELVGKSSDAAGALELLVRTDVDVVVLDRHLPDGGSPESIRAIRRASPGTSVVVAGMALDGGYASEAIGAGASGYVLKDMADTELVDAILAAARGECYVSPVVAARLQAQMCADPRELGASQTAVLRLIALGRRDPEIGLQLGLSELAIEACRADIHRRLGIASRSELSRYALRHGLLAGPEQPEDPVPPTPIVD